MGENQNTEKETLYNGQGHEPMVSVGEKQAGEERDDLY